MVATDQATDTKPGPEGLPSFGEPPSSAPDTTASDSAQKTTDQNSGLTAPSGIVSRQFTVQDFNGKQAVKDHMAWKLANTGAWGVKRSLEFNKQMDTMQDFDQATASDMIRHIDSEYDTHQVEDVTAKYDDLGTKLLDQAYAPMGYGDTKPHLSQIPKTEQYAAAAFALVTALTGGRGAGARAIEALARPLSLQEQENVKKQQQGLENENLRRDGLLQQFKMLMGDKSSAVSQLELTQREGAAQRHQDAQIAEAERNQKATAINQAHARWAHSRDGGSDGGANSPKMAALGDYEEEMRVATGDEKWKASKADYDAANAKSTQQLGREQRTKDARDLDKIRMDQAAPALKHLNLQNATLEYRYKNILPWVALGDQERYLKESLEVDKLRYEKGRGWITAKGTTLAGARAALDSLTKLDAKAEDGMWDAAISRGMDPNDPQQVTRFEKMKADVHEMISAGMTPKQVEERMNLLGAASRLANLGGSDPLQDLVPRMAAVAAAKSEHERKLMQVDASGLGGGPAPAGGGTLDLTGQIGVKGHGTDPVRLKLPAGWK
jgi:hypothetical protein